MAGFPVRVNPAFSDPCNPGAPHPCFDAADRQLTNENHLKRGFIGSPALADLTGDRRLDIVAGALDQHLYAWDGSGDSLPGFPVKLSTPGAPGAEIVTSPAIAELDGQRPREVIVATNEVVPGDPQLPGSIFDIFNAFLGSSTGSNPVYAVDGDGSIVSGWPVQVGVLAGDLLPLVLPGNDAAVLDVDGDGNDEVVRVRGHLALRPGAEARRRRRLDDPHLPGRGRELPRSGRGGQPRRLPVRRRPRRGRLAGRRQGRADPERRREPPRREPEPALLPRRAGLERRRRGPPSPAIRGQPTTSSSSRRPRSPAWRGAGRSVRRSSGTGLYQLHAYGPTGVEAPGWPKFTGGWTQSTPAVGDADGDGKLDVAAVTREGWSFLWRTPVPACGGSNNQWWTFHHDEHGSANYRGDGRPPGLAQEPGGQA